MTPSRWLPKACHSPIHPQRHGFLESRRVKSIGTPALGLAHGDSGPAHVLPNLLAVTRQMTDLAEPGAREAIPIPYPALRTCSAPVTAAPRPGAKGLMSCLSIAMLYSSRVLV